MERKNVRSIREDLGMILLYIDPGTGSMMFSLAIGLLSVAWFGIRKIYLKLKYLSPGREKSNDKIIPLVIFSDDKRYWQTFEPICRELNERGFDMTYLTMSDNDPVLSNGFPHLHAEYIGDGNKAFARLNFLKATMLFATTPGLDVYQWKRSKDVRYYVHIPHGANDSTTGYRSFGLDYYDAVMLSGQYQEDAMRKLEKLRGLPAKEAVMVGVPYLDKLERRFQESPVLPAHGRTVLVAPTWGTSSLFSRFGEAMISALIKTEYHIILRPHPQSFTADKELMEKLMNAFPNSDQIEWNQDADNFEVLRKSDIMISDYSGVIFDFAFVFDRPVICADTKMSTDPLDVWWLGKPLWAVDALPRIGPLLTEDKLPQIKELIDMAIEDCSFTESRHQARDETWAFRGEGAKRAADYLISKYEKLTELTEKPENKLQKDGNRPES